MGFDPGFERPTCLAALKSSDRTKQSVCGWQYIYIYIYIYTENIQKRKQKIFWVWFSLEFELFGNLKSFGF